MNQPLRRSRAIGLLAALLPLALIAPAVSAQTVSAQATPATAEGGYRLPVPALQALVDAPRPPQVRLSPRRDFATLLKTPALPGIDVVAQPELKLAGTRINPHTYASSRFSFGSDLGLLDIARQKELGISGLPADLALADLSWSPDQRHIAFTHVDNRAGKVELWLVEVATRKARRLLAQPLNGVAGTGFDWMPDSRGLAVTLRPQGQGDAPKADATPAGPSIQQTDSGASVRSIRTYQDLLKNERDAAIFAHYLTSQLGHVDLQGKLTLLGKPDLTIGASPAPDGKHLLVQTVERPFSYLVPFSRFPRRIEVLGLDGKRVHTVARLPLVEGLPTGNDAVATGVRRISWRSDAPATLVWAEAQDGGDPAPAGVVFADISGGAVAERADQSQLWRGAAAAGAPVGDGVSGARGGVGGAARAA